MIRSDRDDGVEAYVEHIVCAELDRLAETYPSVEDATSLRDAIADLNSARADVEDFRHDTTARRRLGPRWAEFLEPYLDAVDRAEERVAALRESSPGEVAGVTSDTYRALPREDRVQVLAAMIDVIFVRHLPGQRRGPQASPIDARRVHILWRGQGPDALPQATPAAPSSRGRGPSTNSRPGWVSASRRSRTASPALSADAGIAR